MTDAAPRRRLRRERVEMVLAAAREAGARVKIAPSGEITLDFPAVAGSAYDEEGERLQAAMQDAMGAAKR